MNGAMVVLSTLAIAPNTTIAHAPADVGIAVVLGCVIVDSHVGN